MAPVTPVIMRVLRPRCYRTSLAVYGIATVQFGLAFLVLEDVTGLALPFTALQPLSVNKRTSLHRQSYRTSLAVYGIATSDGCRARRNDF